MAYFLFADAIARGQPLTLFDQGLLRRDFTYIDDIVEGIVRIAQKPPSPNTDYDRNHPDPATSSAPYRILNIGNHTPVPVKDLVAVLEEALGKKANIIHASMQKGDVEATFADVDSLTQLTGFKPQTSLEAGIRNFVSWYQDYYKI